MMRNTVTHTPLKRWVGLGVLMGLLFGLVVQAPARWLSELVAQASHQRVLLINPQGTVWQGSADWVLSDGSAPTTFSSGLSSRLPSRVQWHISPSVAFQNLSLGLQLSVSTACCTTSALQIFVAPTWQGLRINSNDHVSQWPAAWLIGLGAPWNTVQAEGQLQLRTQQLQWLQPWSSSSQAKLSGQAELQWLQLSTRLSTLRPLGNYRVMLTGGDTMQVQLDTLEGSLQLQGHGEWLQGRLRFRGEATAQTEAEAALSNLLNVLGQRRGRVSFLELG